MAKIERKGCDGSGKPAGGRGELQKERQATD